uniref:non-specific serine/threonine protein kinase n=1 Tax=Strongyloides venezuelensis TaxID=75913 RepID=A0A0K0FS41_STRVS
MNSLSIITNAIEVDESFPSVPLLPSGFSFQHISKSSKDAQIISEIKIKSILGKGCFSYIYECEVGNSDGSKKNIAVKIAEERCSNLQNEGRIYNEYLIGRKLRNFFDSSHISLMNLVTYGNFCNNNINFGYIVMDIYKYNMNDVKKLFTNNFQSDEYKFAMINVCLTLCSALKYLSIHNLVHSDIKSDNILCKKLSTDPSLIQNVVLADYGLTNLSGSPCRTSRYFLGPLSYAHIDLLDNIKSLRSDSYMLVFYIMDLFEILPELKQIDGIENARQKKTTFLNNKKNILIKSKKDTRLINMFIDVFGYLSKLNIKDCPNYDNITDIFLKYLPSLKSTLTKYDCLEVKKSGNVETKFQILEISKEKSLIFKNNITIFGSDIDIIKLKNIYKDLSKFDMIACIKAFIQYSNRGFVSVYKYNDEAKN